MLDNKRFIEIEKKLKEEIYEIIGVFYEESTKELSEVDEEIRSFVKSMYTNVEHFRKNIEQIEYEMTKLDCSFKVVIKNIEENFSHFKGKRKRIFSKYIDDMSKIPKSKKDNVIVQFRCINTVKNHEYVFGIFVKDFMEEIRDVYLKNFGDLGSVADQYLSFIEMVNNNNYMEKDYKSIVNEMIEESNFYIKKSDSFDYKEMCKLAESNGFEYKWCNGSHRMYEHKDTHKGLVIPSHTLGVGLSKVIQKQIKNNSSKILIDI